MAARPNDARQLEIGPQGHRKFLNDFFTGRYPGSFAKGVPFQFNPETGDLRISGTLSSLAGLEEAVEKKDDRLIELAVRRINMLRNILVSAGGMPDPAREIFTQNPLPPGSDLQLDGYRYLWIDATIAGNDASP